MSDVFASDLWGIDFMLTTAQYGAVGVNFHGGGQNMDNNVGTNGVTSLTLPFRYSPILEVNSQVMGIGPLFYGMLLVSQSGVGDMLPTHATAGSLNFTAYTISLADGSANIVLVNKDATNGVKATIDAGVSLTSADGVFLLASSLNATSGITFAGSEVSAAGAWTPNSPYTLTASGRQIDVVVAPASAVVVHAQ